MSLTALRRFFISVFRLCQACEHGTNHKPPVKRVVCRRAISPYHYDQRLKALAFTLFKPLCPSYSATP